MKVWNSVVYLVEPLVVQSVGSMVVLMAEQ